MDEYKLEQVFDESKFPELTFVPIKEYPYIKSAMRTAGKHITISGPSGSGKTTVINRILKEEGIKSEDLLWINAREYEQVSSYLELFSTILKIEPLFYEINQYLSIVKFIVIDDFHFLNQQVRFEIAKNLKLLHEKHIRFIIIGISSSAEELVGVDAELGIRNDPFDLKTQDDKFSYELIRLGTEYLNILFSEKTRAEIVQAANGVPSIVHVICRITLVSCGIFETQELQKEVNVELKDLKPEILRIFDSKYFNKVLAITKGKQQARSIHNTYFDIIETIAIDTRSEIPIEYLYEKIVKPIADGKERGKKATSFYNCLNNLAEIINNNKATDLIFYNKSGRTISIEDPSLRFYLNLLDIEKLKSKIHIRSSGFIWDVAISFAGDDRSVAKELRDVLKDKGIEVFYDFDQQAQLWGKDLNRVLTEVYRNEALFMVIIVSNNYPEKDWTNFEFVNGKDAEKERSIEYLLPLRLDDTHVVGLKESIAMIDLRKQSIEHVANVLSEKIENQA
jgi:hypothetical protein